MVRRTLALALLVGIVAVGIGFLVAYATFPSSEELQRESLERLGLPAFIIDSPIVQQVLDEVGAGVEDHVTAEARRSAMFGALSGGLVVVGGFALVLADARRRERAMTAPPPPEAPPATP